MYKMVLSFASALMAINAYAHCPNHFKAEKVCFMWEGNTLYIYDDKIEHNGPYKEMKGYKLIKINELLLHSISRGIYQFKALKGENVLLTKTKKAKLFIQEYSSKKISSIDLKHE